MWERLSIPEEWDGFVFRHRRGARLPPGSHRHEELEANLAVSGTGVYLWRDRRVTLQPGSLLWLFPEQEHLLVEQSPDFAMWVVVWRPRLLAEFAADRGFDLLRERDPPGLQHRRLDGPSTRELSAVLARVSGWQGEPTPFRVGLRHLLVECWRAFQAAGGAGRGAAVHPAVARAAHLLSLPGESPGLEELARRCGLSRGHLSRCFKRQMGLSLAEFRQRQRLEGFLRDLGREGDWNLLQASLRAGFGSYAQFHRVFRRSLGTSPAAYRRELRGASPDSLNEPLLDLTGRDLGEAPRPGESR